MRTKKIYLKIEVAEMGERKNQIGILDPNS